MAEFLQWRLKEKGILDKEGEGKARIIYYESLDIKARGFYKDDLKEGFRCFIMNLARLSKREIISPGSMMMRGFGLLKRR